MPTTINTENTLELCDQWINGNIKHVQGALFNVYKAGKSPYDCMSLVLDMYALLKPGTQKAESFRELVARRFNS